MNRPYIFCRIMTYFNGKIMGSYMGTPEGEKVGDVFYQIAFGTEHCYKHQGWLSGRITTNDNFTFCVKPELEENAPDVPESDFVEEPDYAAAMQKKKELFTIENMMLGGSGVLNRPFIQAGMCDEVSVVAAAL